MSDNSPIESGHDDASHDERVAGLIEQMRADIGQGNVDDIRDMLRQRLADTGIELDDAAIEKLAAELS